MGNPNGENNYIKYCEYISERTGMAIEEAFRNCTYFWTHGIHKDQAVEAIKEIRRTIK